MNKHSYLSQTCRIGWLEDPENEVSVTKGGIKGGEYFNVLRFESDELDAGQERDRSLDGTDAALDFQT
jgi:hypothetical protein